MVDDDLLRIMIQVNEDLRGLDSTIAGLRDLQRQTNILSRYLTNLRTVSVASFTAIKKAMITMKNAIVKAVNVIHQSFTRVVAVTSLISALLIKFGSDANESASKFQAVFGNASNSLDKFAQNMKKSLGIGYNQVKRDLGDIGALFKGFGMDVNQSAEASKLALSTAYDLASYHNLSFSNAMEKIRAGLTGETEPLKAVGIVATVENLQNYAKANNLVYSSLSQMQLAQLRMNYIYEQAVKQGAIGDLARTSQQFANQLRKLKGNIVDVMVDLSKLVMGPVTNFISTLNSVIDYSVNWVKNNKELSKSFLEFGLGLAKTLSAIFLVVEGLMLLTNPTLILIASVIALKLAWDTNLYGIRDTTLRVWEKIKEIVEKMKESFDNGTFFEDFVKKPLKIGFELAFVGTALKTLLAPIFTEAGLLLVTAGTTAGLIASMTIGIGWVFSKTLNMDNKEFLETIESIPKYISEKIGKIKMKLEILTGIWGKDEEIFGGEAGVSPIVKGFQDIIENIKQLFDNFKIKVVDMFDFSIDIGEKITKTISSKLSSLKFKFQLATGTWGKNEAVFGVEQKYIGGLVGSGFAGGGYTGNGGKYTPAGIVHKGEYVLTKQMVSNMPSVVNWLESVRTGKTKGYSRGGGVDISPSPVLHTGNNQSNKTNSSLTELNVSVNSSFLNQFKTFFQKNGKDQEAVKELIKRVDGYENFFQGLKKEINSGNATNKNIINTLKESINKIETGSSKTTFSEIDLKDLITKITNNAKNSAIDTLIEKGETAQTIQNQTGGTTTEIAQKMEDEVTEIVQHMQETGASFEDMQGVLTTYKKAVSGNDEALQKTIDSYKDYEKQSGKYYKNLGSDTTAFGDQLTKVGDYLGSEFLSSLGSITGSVGGLFSSIGSFQEGGGLSSLSSISGLANGLGVVSAGLGVATTIGSLFDSSDQDEDNAKNIQMWNDTLEKMDEIKETLADNFKSLISYTAELIKNTTPTVSNIQNGKSELTGVLEALKNQDKNFSNVTYQSSHTGHRHGRKTTIQRTSTMDLQQLYSGLGFTGNVNTTATSDQLKEFADKLKTLTKDEFRAKFDLDNEGQSHFDLQTVNFSQLSNQIEAYIKLIDKASEQTEKFSKNTTLSDFENIEFNDSSELLDSYIEQYKSMGVTITDQVKADLKALAEDNSIQETISTQIRSGFVNGFTQGSESIDLIGDQMSTYFNGIFTNISKSFYDTQMDNFNTTISNFYKEYNTALASAKQDESVNIFDYANNYDYSSILQAMKQAGNVDNQMSEIFKQIRSQAESLGISGDIINAMLPNDEISKKAISLTESFKTAFSGIFDDMDFSSFESSLGESIFKTIKEKAIEGFMVSAQIESQMTKYIELLNSGEKNQARELMNSIIAQTKKGYEDIKGALATAEQDLRASGLDTGSQTVSDSSSDNQSYYSNSTNSSTNSGSTVVYKQYYISVDNISFKEFAREIKSELDKIEGEEI